jgi:hypothetical protein
MNIQGVLNIALQIRELICIFLYLFGGHVQCFELS